MNESILFAEWLAKNSYSLVLIDDNVCFWKNYIKTSSTELLYLEFKNK